MEQTDACKRHHHIVFIAGLDHCVVSYRAAWFRDIAYAALLCSLDIIGEWEESVRSQGYFCQLIQPCAFFLSGEDFRLLCKGFLPGAVCQHVHVLFSDVHVNGIVSFRAADGILKGQVHHLRALS